MSHQEDETVVCLSYPLSTRMHYYGGAQPELETHVKEKGNKYNQETSLQISSHFGTHIDFPAHFYPGGKKGEDYPFHYFLFHTVALVDFNLLSSERMVDASLLDDSFDSDVEMILFKTHFCEIRDQDRYWKASPEVSSDLADFLRKRFPKLRMVGFDLISVTSLHNKQEGRQAHLKFLDDSEGREILLVEDMNLNGVDGGMIFSEVIVSPLFFENMDGSPCTIIGKV